jgi:(2Fe-2S) ferredoxin
MMRISMYYKKHIFFCINQKDNGKACCQDHDASFFRDYAHQRLSELGLIGAGLYRVNKSGCLGRCELGPILVVYPDEIWYTYESREDIDEIIDSHLLNGKIVQRLLTDPLV